MVPLKTLVGAWLMFIFLYSILSFLINMQLPDCAMLFVLFVRFYEWGRGSGNFTLIGIQLIAGDYTIHTILSFMINLQIPDYCTMQFAQFFSCLVGRRSSSPHFA